MSIDDPERAAREWVEKAPRHGRHRALPDLVMADLYGYIHAHLDGHHHLAGEELESACRRLQADGYTRPQALEACWAAIPHVRGLVLETVTEVALLTDGDDR